MTDFLRIDQRFTYHPPRADQVERYERIRSVARGMVEYLSDVCPNSPELSLAINAVDQAVMWANASIARNSDVS